MRLYIKILDKNKKEKISVDGEDNIYLDWNEEYQKGDILVMGSDFPVFVVVQPDDAITPVLGWLKSDFEFEIPFDEKKLVYSPKSFLGNLHLLKLRIAYKKEIEQYRNLAFNSFDYHENSGLFPHASANVETRGEAVFAARNAINGNTANRSHGCWPYESWGINQQDDACIKIDFGRAVKLDRAIITLRADFPHDNWWHESSLQFSDDSEMKLNFIKTAAPQVTDFAKEKITEWVIMKNFKKDINDPSPFPALTQIELWGNENLY